MYKELINSATSSYPFLIEHKNVRYIPHFHEETEIVYVLGGEVELTFGKSRKIAKEGDICVIPTGQIHNLYTYKDSRTYVIKLYPVADLSGISLRSEIISEGDELYPALKRCVLGIMQEEREQRTGYKLAVNLYAGEISLLLLREFEHSEVSCATRNKHNTENAFLKSVIEYLEENYNSDFGLDDVSNHFNYTKSYFCRYFKKITGNSFWEYYTMYRIERAIELLKGTPRENFTVIANKSGFKNLRSFNQAFKTYCDCTPSEYRKRL